MNVRWFYGRGSDISGPVTGKQLADLAASGQILKTDIVWRDGLESGVPASKVKNLFPPDAATPPDPRTESDRSKEVTDGTKLDVMTSSPPDQGATPETVNAAVIPAAPAESPRPATTKTARATAGRGAVIIGQDGKTVKFRG